MVAPESFLTRREDEPGMTGPPPNTAIGTTLRWALADCAVPALAALVSAPLDVVGARGDSREQPVRAAALAAAMKRLTAISRNM
jgi:hypothetical protein